MIAAVEQNVATLLGEHAALRADRPALIEPRWRGAVRVTYGELAARIAALAGEWRAAGIVPGDRVLLLVPLSIDLIVALLTCFHLGAPAVFVEARLGHTSLDRAIAAASPRAVAASPKASLLRFLSPALRRVPLTLLVTDTSRVLRASQPASHHTEPAPVTPDDPALVTFTTGSTGAPRAAARSHAFLLAQHRALADLLQSPPDDVDLPALPIFVLHNLALGIASVLPGADPRRPERIDPAALYRRIVEEGVTTVSASPAFCERLATWCRDTGRLLPLRALRTGGAPVLPPLARLLRATVAGAVQVVYGGTEAEPISAITVEEMLSAVEGLPLGSPVPGLDVRVVRPYDGPIVLDAVGWEEWEVAPGAIGELVVSGPQVLPGYLEDPEADRRHKIQDGARTWHRTGDAVCVDGAGCLWLMGRVRERVERAGEVWWPLPVEMRVREAPGVTHAAYLALPEGAGESVTPPERRAVLCVEVPSGRLSPADRERLLAAARPAPVDDLRVLRRIPRDPRHASKTDVAALRRRLGRR